MVPFRSEYRFAAPVLFALLLVGLPTARLSACAVPVFRYALERWSPDVYRALVVHRGELSAADREIVEALQARCGYDAQFERPTQVNLSVTVRQLPWTDSDDRNSDDGDSTAPDSDLNSVLPSANELDEPLLLLLSPEVQGEPRVLRKLPLSDRAGLEKALVSPTRSEIGRRITGGETAVWVFLDSGKQEADDRAFAELEKRLADLEKTLQLPEAFVRGLEEGSAFEETSTGASGDVDEHLGKRGPAVRIEFSALRVSRQDAAESFFVEQLLASEDDLLEFDAPMCFPIFGRGRALFALIGKGINKDTVREAGNFLVGSCTCEIKGQNPGTDLLMSVDWDAPLVETIGAAAQDLPPLGGLEAFTAQPSDADPEKSTETPPGEEKSVGSAVADIESHELPTAEGSTPVTPIDAVTPAESGESESAEVSRVPTFGKLGRKLLWLAGGALVLIALASWLVLRKR